jgi:hypothetical protein
VFDEVLCSFGQKVVIDGELIYPGFFSRAIHCLPISEGETIIWAAMTSRRQRSTPQGRSDRCLNRTSAWNQGVNALFTHGLTGALW